MGQCSGMSPERLPLVATSPPAVGVPDQGGNCESKPRPRAVLEECDDHSALEILAHARLRQCSGMSPERRASECSAGRALRVVVMARVSLQRRLMRLRADLDQSACLSVDRVISGPASRQEHENRENEDRGVSHASLRIEPAGVCC